MVYSIGPYTLVAGAFTLELGHDNGQEGLTSALVDASGYVGAIFLMSASAVTSEARILRGLTLLSVAVVAGATVYARLIQRLSLKEGEAGGTSRLPL